MTLRSITLPAPIPFPRAGYGDALAEHARLMTKHAGRLHELAVKRLGTKEDFDLIDHYVGRIGGRGDPKDDKVDLLHRTTAVEAWRGYRGIAGRMIDRPRPYHLYVLVAARGVASLHMLPFDDKHLGPAPGQALVVEPFAQRHRLSGLAPLLVTRWVEPGGEARYAWVDVPPEPTNTAEELDRLLIRHEPAARVQVAEYLAQGATDPFVLVRSDSLGDSIHVQPTNLAMVAATSFPEILAAIDGITVARDRVPLIGCNVGHARLRWIDLGAAGPTAAAPDEIVEVFDWPEELNGPEEPDPERQEAEALTWTKVEWGKSDGAVETWDRIVMSQWFDEIDMHLGALSEAQLDALIAKAGFDPVAERARGYGVREAVVEKIAGLRADEGEGSPA